MRPVLISFGEFDVSSYGLSKALAILAAGWLLGRELRRIGRDPELAWPLAIGGGVGGFAGAKLYYLAEQGLAGTLSAHDFGGAGFTWFGGLIGGALTVLVIAHRNQLSAGLIAGLAAAPLAVGYGIGRLGCLLAGDGTYGTPSSLPWAMSFPEGTVPTTQMVHPTPLYEALAAFAVAALIWRLRSRLRPLALFAIFAVLEGSARFLVEFIRLNDSVVGGLSQAHLWSLVLIAVGIAIAARAARSREGLTLPVAG